MTASWQPPFNEAPNSFKTYDQIAFSKKHNFGIRVVPENQHTRDDHEFQNWYTNGTNGTKAAHTPEEARSFARAHLPRLQASSISIAAKRSEGSEEFTEIRPASTPNPSQHPLLSLAHHHYNLPQQLVENFLKLGIAAIYPWQASCLAGKKLLSGTQNLVYTAPTGGGKSLVADICLMKKVIEHPTKKALVMLPYVALVQEKTRWFRRLSEGITRADGAGLPLLTQRKAGAGITVAAFYGGSKSTATWSDCDIAVCTFEKANLIVNAAIEEGTIDRLGIVVCDELHMIDDEYRGYIIELMLTKLLSLQTEVQIIGMSATLSNPELIAQWLHAKFYVARYRPIPIEEHLVYDNAVYPIADSKEFFHAAKGLSSETPTQRPREPLRVIATSTHQELASAVTNAVVALAVETANANFGALVFCSSRQICQSLSRLIADCLPVAETGTNVAVERQTVLASLQALPDGFESALLQSVPAGVGFHHAGLTVEEREIVSNAYDTGVIKVLVATCSLAAGINLPARRVILNGAKMGRDLVGPAMLRQMRGRAGRKGKDEIGETFLCCQKLELDAVAELLDAELPQAVSCLTSEKRGLSRAILEILAIRLVNTYQGLRDYTGNCLLWHTSPRESVLRMLDEAVQNLLGQNLITKAPYDTLAPTPLGCAIVASGLTPEDGLFAHADLRSALSSFAMDTELHIFYLFTPIPSNSPTATLTSDISWPVFRTILGSLDEPSVRALRHIGVSPAMVNRLANDGTTGLPESTTQEIRTARIYRRVYSTFALRDICNEIPISTIALRYNLPRGHIQTLAQTCHGFAAGMIKFCQRMAAPPLSETMSNHHLHSTSVPDPQASGFSMLAAILTHMQSRLYAGARSDLLELAQVTFVKGRMARLLYENGFKSVRMLADADPKKDILPLLLMLSGYKLRGKKRKSMEENEGDDAEAARAFELRRSKLEEKLEGQAEVMVRSAGAIWEREVLQGIEIE